MAGTLSTNWLLVVVALCGLIGGVSAEYGAICPAVEQCSDDFNNQASHIGHDQPKLCELLKSQYRCYTQVRSSCTTEQLQYVQSKIQNSQLQMRSTCGAAWMGASHWLLIVSAILTLLYHR